MEIKFKPKGVCSQAIRLELTDGVVHNVRFTGGCPGNAQGVARLRGIRCGFKPTSCPDQLASALEQVLAAQEEK